MSRQVHRSCEVFDPEHHRGLLGRLRIEHGLRWRDDQGVLRSAYEFIDVAETSGMILSIGRWVLQQACSDATNWPVGANGRACGLSVNLSARQFEQPGLVAMVTEVLRETGFPPQRLCLEITETTLMSRAQSALDTLHALKALGVSLAVDDFGTGYSSLAYLKRFPVDTLKIDKSLIDSMPGDPHAFAIVAAVLGLAHAMELGVVVVGVERSGQADELRDMGCERVQGWLYAKGEPNADFIARLSAQG